MTIYFNLQGAERKQLVQAAAEILCEHAQYMGMPTASYQVGSVTIDANGAITFPEALPSETAEQLIAGLEAKGYHGYSLPPEDVSHTDITEVVIQVPRETMSDTALENLQNLLSAKGALITKALGIPSAHTEITPEWIGFPWCIHTSDSETVQAITVFVHKLCEMARTQSRISPQSKDVVNEKYAFRCFLLRLGFIGNHYKCARKILLKHLTGSGAFKNHGLEEASCKAPTQNERSSTSRPRILPTKHNTAH